MVAFALYRMLLLPWRRPLLAELRLDSNSWIVDSQLSQARPVRASLDQALLEAFGRALPESCRVLPRGGPANLALGMGIAEERGLAAVATTTQGLVRCSFRFLALLAVLSRDAAKNLLDAWRPGLISPGGAMPCVP